MQKFSHAWRELPYSQPTVENSGFSLTEQCDPSQDNQLSEHFVSSGKISPSDISLENKVVVVRLWWKKLLQGLPWRGDLTRVLGLNQVLLQILTPNLLLVMCLQRFFSRRNFQFCLCQLLHRRLQWIKLFKNKFQSTNYGKRKPLRFLRNFNLVYLRRLVAYITF